MRQSLQFIFFYCTIFVWLSSCIDDYETPESNTGAMVVIFGQIVENSDCVFTLRSTATPTGSLEKFTYIKDATICVKGTDGQTFNGIELSGGKGRYSVPVGNLNPVEKYYVEVSTRYGVFESEPMSPLDAPALKSIHFEQPRADKKVDILVSSEDAHGLVYLLWQVDEYWEIWTPLTSHWEYRVNTEDDLYSDNPQGSFVQLAEEEIKNHGWQHAVVLSAVASNEDYALGAVTRKCILQRSNTSHRFQTRYCARIKQMAITREEYEFRKLQQTQASDVGGLFTQMPSELPSNIRSLSETRAIGFVGVRGKVSTKELYINGSDVGYKNQDTPEIIPEDKVLAPNWMINYGYRVYNYNPETDIAKWTYDWCVDYRSSHWGGDEALECPDFWTDK